MSDLACPCSIQYCLGIIMPLGTSAPATTPPSLEILLELLIKIILSSCATSTPNNRGAPIRRGGFRSYFRGNLPVMSNQNSINFDAAICTLTAEVSVSRGKKRNFHGKFKNFHFLVWILKLVRPLFPVEPLCTVIFLRSFRWIKVKIWREKAEREMNNS